MAPSCVRSVRLTRGEASGVVAREGGRSVYQAKRKNRAESRHCSTAPLPHEILLTLIPVFVPNPLKKTKAKKKMKGPPAVSHCQGEELLGTLII
ncbi:hypothetical protein SKAU_G00380800 [Synaphobranchus kaupii]|uniref:Uncharacterized protein n=1 Tax=Synaphobranchus kaupii TaxID=118154 RepID=A0A9Q1EDK8_SYNKA|nr:hypothetical protein SKAU_G00380800 [Synaphobranchus kaupii]